MPKHKNPTSPFRYFNSSPEILKSYVTKKRDKAAALAFLKKALKRHGSAEAIVTDGLRSYSTAMLRFWQM